MKKKVAVLLSGCGVYDGAEIYETVLTLLRLDEKDASYQCIAPNLPQRHVIDHHKGEEVYESKAEGIHSRNVLQEAARLARGEILPLDQAKADDYDAIILPGGFGVAKNFSSFAEEGAECSVEPSIRQFVQAFHKAGKPIGLMCIAPAITAKLLAPGILCTVGSDPGVEGALIAMGGLHKTCAVDDIVVDNTHKVVSTPAYMLATRISEAKSGIFKLVDKVLELT